MELLVNCLKEIYDETSLRDSADDDRIRRLAKVVKTRNNEYAPLDVCVVTPLERLKEEADEQTGSFRSEKSSESGAVVFTDVSEPIYKLNFKLEPSGRTNLSSSNLLLKQPEAALKENKQNQNVYNAFKELLMSERTFTSDLRILAQNFFNFDGQNQAKYGKALGDLQVLLKTLFNFHQNLLHEIEEKFSEWHTSTQKCDSDATVSEGKLISLCELLLCSVHNVIQHYRNLVQHSPIYIAAINELKRTDKSFAKKVREFEDDPLCYISLQWLLLNTVFHMVVWQNVLGRIIASFLEEGDSLSHNKHISSCRIAMEKIATFNTETSTTRNGLINFVKLLEIESEVDGVDNITQANRQFIREGFMLRWNNTSNKMVPQIVIAFSDVLLYATLRDDNIFIVNGVIPFRDARIGETETEDLMIDSSTSLLIATPKNTVLFASTSTHTYQLWKEDILRMISTIGDTKTDQLPQPVSVRFYGYEGQSADAIRSFNAEKSTFKSTDTLNQQVYRDSSKVSTLRLCWHRQTTITADALINAATNQFSGYLLRKYRTSSGWQRLWVVLAAFTLFFYKDYTEPIPLASLNLIDYHITLPLVSDGIGKNNVFKLSYLKHSYFFRAENIYEFARWIEVIRTATQNNTANDVFTNLIAKAI